MALIQCCFYKPLYLHYQSISFQPTSILFYIYISISNHFYVSSLQNFLFLGKYLLGSSHVLIIDLKNVFYLYCLFFYMFFFYYNDKLLIKVIVLFIKWICFLLFLCVASNLLYILMILIIEWMFWRSIIFR